MGFLLMMLWMAPPPGPTIVNAIGPIRQLVRGADKIPRRNLMILSGTPDITTARPFKSKGNDEY
jgi:hypothetical protein